jgi:dihydropteroate synthase
MAVVNVTPDSFSDGGRFAGPDEAAAWALDAAEQGAAIIDVGGESTRPGADAVPEEEELRRVVPVIERIRRRSPVPIAVDTSKAAVAREAIAAGATMVNDITALGDPEMAGTVAGAGVDLALMHMQGTPRTMQERPHYDDVVAEVSSWLRERVDVAVAAGVDRERICVDPGIGFGKTLEHNLALLVNLPALEAATGAPVLVGVSRKSFLGRILGDAGRDRTAATLAADLDAAARGAWMLRVHDPGEHADALRVRRALLAAEPPAGAFAEGSVELAIDGLVVVAHHGALAAERELGQRFVVDLRLTPESTRAADTDDLRDAVDYGRVALRARELVEGGPYALLERLGDEVARTLLAEFALRRVTVRVAKPSAPIPAAFDAVSVTVTRHAG